MSTYEIRDDILPPTRQPAPNKRRSPETKLAAKQAAMAALGMEYSTRRIGDPIDVEQTIRRIKACIEKGDKAAERANDLYVTAGQHLLSLNSNTTPPRVPGLSGKNCSRKSTSVSHGHLN